MLDNYKQYLEFLDNKLKGFFDSQSPFVFCKAGCTHCCKNSQFPYSLLEMKYLLSSLGNMPECVATQVESNLQKVLLKRKNFKGKQFKYDCPFLVNNKCSVYEYRGIICRTFGLMTHFDGNKVRAPFCSHLGLNYSNVLNLKKRTISARKYKKLNTTKEPLGFNVRYSYLTDVEFETTFGIKFGEVKPMIDWFAE